jgi:NAD(P)-dependent dehydrogenase (short-subunit alcohol dehydrogenase family)
MPYVEKVTIVTGGENGIARAIALRLPSEGAAILIMGLRPEDADAAAESISKTGSRALAATGDARVEGDIAATVERAVLGVYRPNAAR